jgi:hypothetical protein
VGSGLASLTKRRLAHFGVEMDLSEKVKISTIDDHCSDRGIAHIDLLKLDVEGHELDVLNGGSEMFRKSAIHRITFEFVCCNIATRTFFQDFLFFPRPSDEDCPNRTFRVFTRAFFVQGSAGAIRTSNFLCYRS